MHIALCHGSVVPPARYGGTERVVAWLAKALLEQGHEVTLVCPEGSRIEGARRSDSIPASADIVHFHAPPGTPPERPYLVTIHGNGKPGEKFLQNTVFLSQRHAANHGSTHFVYNGIDVGEYECLSQREPYLVFLAKASWSVKNLPGAIELARAIDLPLWVMGSRSYPFELQRRLPAFRGVRYLGMVGDVEKRKVLRASTALVFPVRWEEPFGLAVTEALASGCAVFGTPYGSLPELVTSDVGVLSTDTAGLAEAFRGFRFVPEACRAHVERRFTHRHMAQAYVRYYELVLEKGGLPGPAPLTRPGWNAKELLPWGLLS